MADVLWSRTEVNNATSVLEIYYDDTTQNQKLSRVFYTNPTSTPMVVTVTLASGQTLAPLTLKPNVASETYTPSPGQAPNLINANIGVGISTGIH